MTKTNAATRNLLETVVVPLAEIVGAERGIEHRFLAETTDTEGRSRYAVRCDSRSLRVGDAISGTGDHEARLSGYWFVESIADGCTHLVDAATYPCSEYSWCSGHTRAELEQGNVTHLEEPADSHTFSRISVDISRVRAAGGLLHGVHLAAGGHDLDVDDLDAAGMRQLASDLESIAAAVRRLTEGS